MKNNNETTSDQESREISIETNENNNKETSSENSDKMIEESKSGRFQPAVDKLADIQRDIKYGLSLLRLNDWFDERNVREEDKAVYEEYTSRIERLKQMKNKFIDEMMDQIKQDDRYKNLSEKDLQRIRDEIDAGSTRSGFYFNDDSINRILKK